MNKKALTLFEILVSVIILALVVTGLANVFVAGKSYIQHSRSRVTAVELGKFFLDPLQNDVNQTTWTSTSKLGTKPINYQQIVPIDNKSYTGIYTFTNHLDNPSIPENINKVKVQITWPRSE